MSRAASTDPRSLVKTEAETVPPPGPTVPEPNHRPADVSPDLLGRIQELAGEVGGIGRLRAILDELEE